MLDQINLYLNRIKKYITFSFKQFSIGVNYWFYRIDQQEDRVDDSPKELPYAQDHEDFLQLVEPNYKDEDLFEWEPAIKIEGDSNEPGYLGCLELEKYYFVFTLIDLNPSKLILLGKPVVLTPEQQTKAEARETENYFNVVVSEMLSPNRTVPDLRVPE